VVKDFDYIASHSCGTHALQRYIEMLKDDDERVRITSAVRDKTISLAMVIT